MPPGLFCVVAMLLFVVWVAFNQWGWITLVFAALVAVGVRDSLQSKRAVLRNYPVIGHVRFLLEFIRPEIRQYFIESDNEAHPFSRQQRSLVYQRAKGDPDKRPFGTQLDVHAQGYEWINHSLMPTQVPSHDFRVLIGEGRAQPYSASVFNISAMSFGALSANAILALNGGAQARRLRARHRRRLDQRAPPRARRRSDLGNRLGLLRLPPRRRRVRRRALRRPTRATRR